MLALDINKNIIYKRFLFWLFPVKLIVQHNNFYDCFKKQIITKTTKTNKTRIICLDLKCSIFLYFYIKKLKEENKTKLFSFNPNVLTTKFHNVVKKAGIKNIRITDLRHLHASYLLSKLSNKANCIKIVQERLGHSNVQQTLNTYSHILKKDEKKAIKYLNFI